MIKRGIILALAAVLSLAVAAPVFAQAPGEVITNTLSGSITVQTQAAKIWVNQDLDLAPPVTYTDEFTVSTDPGSDVGKTVRVKVTLAGDKEGLDLQYYEEKDAKYHPLQFDANNVTWYGPEQGFPFAKATSNFKVTWKKMGKYTATLEVIQLGTNTTLATTVVTVEVGPALLIGWELPTQAVTNVPFEVKASAKIASYDKIQKVDRVLYVIEVTDGSGNPVGSGVVTATVSGEDGAGTPDAVKDVPLGYDPEGKFFYFGDRNNGFSFTASDQVDNVFTVKILKDGTYNVKAYAVQLP